MNATLKTLNTQPTAASGGSANSHHHARAFSGGSPPAVDLQALVRFREKPQRASVIASNVPSGRVKQILQSVLALPSMEGVTADVLRVDVHRPDAGKYHHDYGLALAVAMVSSLVRKSIGEQLLFLGDVDLQERIRDVAAKRVDRLNEAVASFEIETPLRIICAPETAAWLNASSTVVVAPALTLADAVAAVWPGSELLPRF
jgi:predicted ATP-dependent serine protease